MVQYSGLSQRDDRSAARQLQIPRSVRGDNPADRTFAAISDPTRRGILDQLGRGDASIGALATRFAMTMTGMKKHVQILEAAGLVATEKVGRVRMCRLGEQRLDAISAWVLSYQQAMDARLDRLEAFLERTQGDSL